MTFQQNTNKLNISKTKSDCEIFGSTACKLVRIEKMECFQRVVYTLFRIRKVEDFLSFLLQLDNNLLNLDLKKKHDLEKLKNIKIERKLQS